MNSVRNVKRRTRGFTLLEVLVALAVVAISLAAVIKSTAEMSAGATYLRDKTFAHWVAMNRMAELRLEGKPPAIGFDKGKAEMAGHEWFWNVKVDKTEDSSIRRVDITVRSDDDEDLPALANLSGFFSTATVSATIGTQTSGNNSPNNSGNGQQ